MQDIDPLELNVFIWVISLKYFLFLIYLYFNKINYFHSHKFQSEFKAS
jgi:hypothetical protein